MAHAKLAPSSAYRWLHCTSSLALIDSITSQGPPPPNEAAEEGTAAHAVLELLLYNRFAQPPSTLLLEVEQLGEKYDIDQMEEDLTGAVATVVDLMARDPKARLFLEEQVHLKRISENLWGTADVVIHLPTLSEIHVIDLKYGRIEVDAEDNAQLQIYLLGALDTILKTRTFPKHMEVHIAQPKCWPGHKSWVVEPDHLIQDFLPKLTSAVAVIETDIDTAFHASPKTCQYCPAIHVCPEALAQAQKAARSKFMKVQPTIESCLEMVPVVRKWADAIEEDALKRLSQGKEIEGWKIGEGPSRRRWVNDSIVTKRFARDFPLDKIAPRKLIGIPAMEKLIKSSDISVDEQEFREYITKPAGKQKLVRSKT